MTDIIIDIYCERCRMLREDNSKGNIFCIKHRYKLFTDAMDEIRMILDKKIKELDYGWDYHDWEKKRHRLEAESARMNGVKDKLLRKA